MRDTRRTTYDRRYEEEEDMPDRGDYARGSERPGETTRGRGSSFDRPIYGEGNYGERTYRDRGHSERGEFAGRGPRTFRRSDERIYDEVGDRFTRDPWLDASDIDFEVKDATVILRGTVPDREAKRRAEDIAESVTGVDDVRNEIRVAGRDRAGERWGTSGVSGADAGTRMTVVGAFRDMNAADRAINELKSLGFTREDISFVTKERGASPTTDTSGTTGAETKGAGAGAILGGIGGGALGWLLGIGALTIPGVGPVVAAGALAATIAGAAAGVVAGGLVGALVGAGVPENEAKDYEKQVKEGRTLVTVSCVSDDEKDRAKDVLRRLGGEKVEHFKGDRRDMTTTRSGNGHTRESMDR